MTNIIITLSQIICIVNDRNVINMQSGIQVRDVWPSWVSYSFIVRKGWSASIASYDAAQHDYESDFSTTIENPSFYPDTTDKYILY